MTRSNVASRLWIAAAAVLGIVMVGIYLTVITSQGDPLTTALPWAIAMAAPAALALSALLIADPRLAKGLLIPATVLWFALGILAVLSIGVGFLLAGLMGSVGIARLGTEQRRNNTSSSGTQE